ncbi:hypothetical protein IGI04_032994, partial [Brassica rapa subsp. trilocularis]
RHRRQKERSLFSSPPVSGELRRCREEVIPTLMWGGTSSIGSCEAELRYISGWLSCVSCLSTSFWRFESSQSRVVCSCVCLVVALCPNPLDISSVLHQGRRLRGVLVEFQVEISMWRQFERFVWSVVPLEDVITGALGWLFLLLKWLVKLRGVEVVQSLGLKPTGFPDFLVRGCGALAQLRAVFE